MHLLHSCLPVLAQASEQWWSEHIFGLDQDQRFALLIVAIGCATGVICTVVVFVSTTITSIHGRRLDAALKRDMIERGMNAEEIARILEAASTAEDAT